MRLVFRDRGWARTLSTEPPQCRSLPSCTACANPTASQSVRRLAIMWVHPRTSGTPTDALPWVPEITDTEEVTGSNPVSPTSIFPSQGWFPARSTSNVPNARQIPNSRSQYCERRSARRYAAECAHEVLDRWLHRLAKTRGWCNKHYSRWWRTGNPLPRCVQARQSKGYRRVVGRVLLRADYDRNYGRSRLIPSSVVAFQQ